MSGNKPTKQNWALNNIAQDPTNKIYESVILKNYQSTTRALSGKYILLPGLMLKAL